MDGDKVRCLNHWNSVTAGIKGVQKNFCAVTDRKFLYIAGTFPNGVLKFDISTNQFSGIGKFEPERLLRGNAPLVKTDEGYMAIVHDLVPDEYGRKRYRNYIVNYNKDLSVRDISKPFKLTDSNIEFITTFMLDGEDILIGDTIMDETPLLFRFNKAEFLELVNMR